MSDLKGYSQMQARLGALKKAPGIVTRTIVIHGVANGKRLVHRKTGNLGRTIRPGRITETSGEVLAGGTRNVGYARAEEQGRGPVTIRPRNKKALAWGGARRLSGSLRVGATATNFATVVHQKARPGHPYLVPGLQEAAQEHGISTVVKIWNDAA